MALFSKKQKNTEKTTTTQEKGTLLRPVAILRPRVTEKSFRMAQQNQYAFDMNDKISKQEAVKQIESIYGVTVVRSQTVRRIHKKPNLRGKAGKSAIEKKIIVTVVKGQSIDITGKA